MASIQQVLLPSGGIVVAVGDAQSNVFLLRKKSRVMSFVHQRIWTLNASVNEFM